MSDIPNSTLKIQAEGVSERRPWSESTLQAIGGLLNYLIETVDDHEARIDDLESVTASNASAIGTSNSTLSVHESRLVNLEAEFVSYDSRLDAVESTLSLQTSEINTLNAEVADQTGRLDDLETSLDNRRSQLDGMRVLSNDTIEGFDPTSFNTGLSFPGGPSYGPYPYSLLIIVTKNTASHVTVFCVGAKTYFSGTDSLFVFVPKNHTLAFTSTISGEVLPGAAFRIDTSDQSAFTF